MKKLLLLVPFLSLFVACSADTDTEELANYTKYSAARQIVATPVPQGIVFNCFNSLTATANLNTTNGPGSGTLTFTAQCNTVFAPGNYRVRVDIEQISDCENLSTGTGNVLSFTNGTIYTDAVVNTPQVIGVNPASTFACYRWKLVVEGVSRTGSISCVSETQWYDAPLF